MGQGTTTLVNLRRMLSRAIGDQDIAVAVTTAINADKEVTSTHLTNYVKGNDAYNDQWCYIRDQNNSQVDRLISDYTHSTGKLDTEGAALSDDSSNMANIEIHKFGRGTFKNASLIDMCAAIYPDLYKRLEDETLHTFEGRTEYTIPSAFLRPPVQVFLIDPPSSSDARNILDNADFEDGTTNWAGSSVTISAEQIGSVVNPRVYSGDQSLKCITTASSTGTVVNDVTTASDDDYDATDLRGSRLTFEVLVYCRQTSLLKALMVLTGGTNVTSSSFHAGLGWELLTVSANIANAVTAVKVGITVASTSPAETFWIDNCVLTIAAEKSLRPPKPLYNWKVWNDVLRFPYLLPPRKQLRLVGRTTLTKPSAESDAVEVDLDYADMLIRKTAIEIMERLKAQVAASDASRFDAIQAEHIRRLRTLQPMPNLNGQSFIPTWAPPGNYWS